MSRRQKRQFRFATFTIVPVLLALAALLPAFLMTSDEASALSGSQWTTVKNAVDSFITNQYDKGPDDIAGTADDPAEGEAGFMVNRANLKARLDSNSNWDLTAANAPSQILGEGDNAVNAPVLIDNLVTQGTTIPGTSVRCNYNGSYGTANCFDADKVAEIAGRVDNHEAAGFSTDILVYCATARTESVTVGGLGPLAQTGALGGTTPPKVMDYKWGRNGWTGTTTTTSAATGATGSVAAPSTTYASAANPTPCNSYVSDQDVVRCTAQWAIYNGAGDPAWGGNGYNVSNGITTAPTTTNQVIDVRTPSPASTMTITGGLTTLQIPSYQVFNSGLQYFDARTTGTKNVFVGRTHQLPGILATGSVMMGYNSTFYVWGVNSWNTSLAGESYQTGNGLDSPVYALLAATASNETSTIDIAAPTISGGTTTTSAITATTVDVARSASEPATSKIALTGSDGHVVNFNDTVLNANKTVTVTGLHDGVAYSGTLTAYDGQANASAPAAIASFTTTDVTGPVVTDILPSGTINTRTATFSANYSDAGVGVDAASVMVHLDVSNMLMDCPVQTTSRVECNATNLTAGTHPIDVYVSDLNGTETIATSSVTVADNTAPVVTVPADMTVEATSASGAVATFSSSALDDFDGAITPTCVAASGSTFPLGTTSVTCSATDAAGNPGSNSFNVTVQDTTAPVVTVPAPITVEATGATGAVATFSASATDNIDGPITATCVAPSGSTFPLGTTSVTCSATDAAGNPGSDSFNVTVQDTTAPEVTAPADMTVEATSASGAVATFSASANDIVDGAITPTCLAPSGSTFPLGTTSVTCSATDAAGNSTGALFNVTVQDTTSPVVTVPADITALTADPGGKVVSFTASANDIVDGAITPTCAPLSGTNFPVGITPVTCTATDAAGNPPGSDTFNVTVELSVVPDTTPPVVTVPADMTVEATSASGAVVSFSASALDDFDGPITPTCVAASGSAFPMGTTSVTCSATDSSGNPGSDSFNVTVQDTTAPVVTVPADMTLEATGASGAIATFSSSANDNIDGAIISNCAPPSGSTFAIGTTLVTCTATDAAGNPGSDSFNVTVQDTTAPVVTVPADMTIEATSASGAVASFSSSASDIVDGSITPTCVAPSGSTFPLGTTSVTCTATDAAGNPGSDSFNVTVEDTTAPVTTNNAQAGWMNLGTYTDLTLTCSDTTGSGCASTVYTIDGGTTQTGNTVHVDTEGDHVIIYHSVDIAGNVGADGTAHMKLDLTSPVTSNDAPAGWTNANFDVTFSCADGASGCTNIWTGLDGAANAPGGLGANVVIPITTEADHTITYFSQDYAGHNEEIGSVHAKLDKTNPEVSGVTGDISTVSAYLSDSLSGIDEDSIVVTVDAAALSGCTPSASSVSCPTPGGLTVGSHPIVVTVDDNAGNPGTASGTLEVTDYPSAGAIGVKRDGLGGAAGQALGPEYAVMNGDVWLGQAQDFSNGRIYWSPGGGSYWVHGGILVKYDALGGPAGLYGMPVSDEYDIAGGRGQNFAGCSIYWSTNTGAHGVRGAIQGKLLADGGVAVDGFPTTDEYDVAGFAGARAQDFEKAQIYWTPAMGSHTVFGGIMTRYMSLGGPAVLGLPMTDEYNILGIINGRESDFQLGRIYYHPITGIVEVRGGILVKYLAAGGPTGFLGMPTVAEADVAGVADAREGSFQRGRIYWSPTTGSHTVNGGIFSTYIAYGGPTSALGLPITDEYSIAIPGARRSRFQGGFVTLVPGVGAWVTPM